MENSHSTFRAMKLKNDKWAKLVNVDENAILIFDYFDKGDQGKLVFTLNSSGAIQVTVEKNKSYLKEYKTIVYRIVKAQKLQSSPNWPKTCFVIENF